MEGAALSDSDGLAERDALDSGLTEGSVGVGATETEEDVDGIEVGSGVGEPLLLADVEGEFVGEPLGEEKGEFVWGGVGSDVGVSDASIVGPLVGDDVGVEDGAADGVGL